MSEDTDHTECDAVLLLAKKTIEELVSQLKAAEAENERLREENRWIPVGERLPKEEEYYDVIFDAGISGQAFWNGKRWRKTPTLRRTENITHWKLIILP